MQFLIECLPFAQHSGYWSLVKKNSKKNYHQIEVYSARRKIQPFKNLRGKVLISQNKKVKLRKKFKMKKPKCFEDEQRKLFPMVIAPSLKVQNGRSVNFSPV